MATRWQVSIFSIASVHAGVLCGSRNGGESGIRTHVTLSSKHAFQACAFSHSAISPALSGSYCKRNNDAAKPAAFDSMGAGPSSQPGDVKTRDVHLETQIGR